MRPVCVTCASDGVDEPVPGLPVFGVFAHLSNGHFAYKYVQASARALRRGARALAGPTAHLRKGAAPGSFPE